MSVGRAMNEQQITISDCHICKALGEKSTSFSKIGREDEARSLPPEAARLLPVASPSVSTSDTGVFRRCPLCGTFYSYEARSEFLIGGSEEEEELTRLTPDQVKALLTDCEYQALLSRMSVDLEHPDGKMRRYASRCLAFHHLQGGQAPEMRPYLAHHDPAIVAGGLELLREVMRANEQNRSPETLALPLVEARVPLEALLKLRGLLSELGASDLEAVGNPARYVLTWLTKYEQRLQKSRAAPEPVTAPAAATSAGAPEQVGQQGTERARPPEQKPQCDPETQQAKQPDQARQSSKAPKGKSPQKPPAKAVYSSGMEGWIEALRDRNPELRQFAARHLAECGDHRAVPALERMALEDIGSVTVEGAFADGTEQVYEAALEALRAIYAREGVTPEDIARMAVHISGRYNYPNGTYQVLALGGEGIRPLLKDALSSSEPREVIRAMKTLAILNEPGVAEAQLSHPDAEVRREASSLLPHA